MGEQLYYIFYCYVQPVSSEIWITSCCIAEEEKWHKDKIKNIEKRKRKESGCNWTDQLWDLLFISLGSNLYSFLSFLFSFLWYCIKFFFSLSIPSGYFLNNTSQREDDPFGLLLFFFEQYISTSRIWCNKDTNRCFKNPWVRCKQGRSYEMIHSRIIDNIIGAKGLLVCCFLDTTSQTTNYKPYKSTQLSQSFIECNTSCT